VTIAGTAADETCGSGLLGVFVSDARNPAFRRHVLNAQGQFEYTTRFRFEGQDDGPQTVTFRAVDKAGNFSDATFTFTLDTALPPLDVEVELDPAFDTGTAGDNRTEDAAVTLAGITRPGAEVVLVETGDSTVADDNGDFVFEDVQIELGVNEFTVHVADFDEEAETTIVIVRNSPPTVASPIADFQVPEGSGPSTFDLDDVFADADLADTDTRNDDALTYAATSDTEVLATATVDPATGVLTLTYTPGLHGRATIRVTATDANGQVATEEFVVTVGTPESEPPAVTLTAPPSGQTVNQNVTVQGTVTDNVAVAVLEAQVDGGAFAPVQFNATDGTFSFTTAFATNGSADGPHTVAFRARDTSGNFSPVQTFTLTLDTQVAATSVGLDAASDTGTQGDLRTEQDTVTLAGTTEAGATVLLLQTGATTTADGQGAFSFTGLTLAMGTNPFTVRATDTAGNQAETSIVVVRNTAPAVVAALADFQVPASAAPTSINLPTVFSDADINTLVRFTTNRGTIDLELFDQQVGVTVANFVTYVTSGRYTDTIFHRTTRMAGDGIAVLQGGGFKLTDNPPQSQLTPVTTDAPIPLQAGLTNARGTVAMARLGVADTTTATSQFFINTGDNPVLDTVGGGYAVFGAIRDPGMAVVDQHYATPEQNRTDGTQANSAFGEIPLINFPESNTNFPEETTRANYEIINAATVVRQPQAGNDDALTFQATSSNASLVTPSIDANTGRLTLTYAPGQTGQSTIQLTATDANGQSATVSFVVTVG
jgi:cyclophilin family peptidyl-prolyl cis-trans isomerase